jgi:hypothetical protein
MSLPTIDRTSSETETTRLCEIPPSLGQPQGWLARILRNRVVQIGIAAWIVFAVSIPFLARGTVPFDQPDLAGLSYSSRVWSEVLGPVYALILICVIFALTHGRSMFVRAFQRGLRLGAKPLPSCVAHDAQARQQVSNRGQDLGRRGRLFHRAHRGTPGQESIFLDAQRSFCAYLSESRPLLACCLYSFSHRNSYLWFCRDDDRKLRLRHQDRSGSNR